MLENLTVENCVEYYKIASFFQEKEPRNFKKIENYSVTLRE